MPRGKVAVINRRRGLVAIQTEDEDLVVIELLGTYDVDLGDVISGDEFWLGGEDFFNHTKQEELSVSVEATGCSVAAARRLMA